jgi:uncharacterized protein YndB with AHSA1/START domain
MTDSLRLKARASAPVAAVRTALTDASALSTWLAEFAAVDLPGTYEFWGRYTPDGDGPHQTPLAADDRILRFAWHLGGEDTTTEFSLDEDGDGTLVTLTQSHLPGWPALMDGTAGVRGVLQTYWPLSIANLVDHLDGRPLTPKCDFSTPEMRAAVEIGAPSHKVFESMIEPEQFRQWFGANVGIEPKVGGRFAMGGFDANSEPATIVEFEAGRKVVIDFGGMVSSWELEGSAGRTRLTFVNSGFDRDDPPYAAWSGWLGGVASLRRFHEVADWGIWRAVEVPGMPAGMLSAAG